MIVRKASENAAVSYDWRNIRRLHSVENPPYIGIPFVVVSGFMGVIAPW
jgi:hypothetical protein